jgi:thiamine transporter ThiT
MTYGLIASFYVAAKVPMQPQAMISLSIFAIIYAGLKAALVGTLLWGLFALCARIRAR